VGQETKLTRLRGSAEFPATGQRKQALEKLPSEHVPTPQGDLPPLGCNAQNPLRSVSTAHTINALKASYPIRAQVRAKVLDNDFPPVGELEADLVRPANDVRQQSELIVWLSGEQLNRVR